MKVTFNLEKAFRDCEPSCGPSFEAQLVTREICHSVGTNCCGWHCQCHARVIIPLHSQARENRVKEAEKMIIDSLICVYSAGTVSDVTRTAQLWARQTLGQLFAWLSSYTRSKFPPIYIPPLHIIQSIFIWIRIRTTSASLAHNLYVQRVFIRCNAPESRPPRTKAILE